MRRRWLGLAFIAPAFLHLAAFALFPVVWTVILSFQEWRLIGGEPRWTGLENYLRLASDGPFWQAMGNTLVYSIFSVPLGMAAGLGAALLVARESRIMAFFRTLFYLPAISSQTAIAMVWIAVYLPETGLLNALLGSLGLPSATDFLNEQAWAMPALIFMSIWVGLGPRMVLFLAGLMAIPAEVNEAASLDGATGARRFWRITLPLLAPASLFVFVTSTIGAMQVFTPVYMMTKGGPAGATDVAGRHIYASAWEQFRLGDAAAQSVVLLAVILALAWAQMRLMKGQVEAAGAA